MEEGERGGRERQLAKKSKVGCNTDDETMYRAVVRIKIWSFYEVRISGS